MQHKYWINIPHALSFTEFIFNNVYKQDYPKVFALGIRNQTGDHMLFQAYDTSYLTMLIYLNGDSHPIILNFQTNKSEWYLIDYTGTKNNKPIDDKNDAVSHWVNQLIIQLRWNVFAYPELTGISAPSDRLRLGIRMIYEWFREKLR